MSKKKSNILFFQSSDDQSVYRDMLEITYSINKKYTEKYGYNIQKYCGVKRGPAPWYATFNRHYLIPELIESDKFDWIVYMDADAFVFDHSIDFESFIHPYDDKALIVSRGGSDTVPWDFNAGVLIINARHPKSLEVFANCRNSFSAIPMQTLDKYKQPWSLPGIDDQNLMHNEVRKDVQNGKIDYLKIFIGDEANMINYSNGRYIRQIIRPDIYNLNLEERLRIIKETADKIIRTFYS
ncbi:MAG: hypothetical protein HOJ88_08405 [Proteobacteria bacterium]|jgi:hypothetical protein|nr:hypothetical protein [Pseudomonadota bacterium]